MSTLNGPDDYLYRGFGVALAGALFPLAIFCTSTSPTLSPMPSTSPPMNSMTTWEATRAAAASTLGFSGGLMPLAWRPLILVLAHTAWRWYSHTVQRYTFPDLRFLHSPQTKEAGSGTVVGSILRVWGWAGYSISLLSMAQHGCIWKAHAVHRKPKPFVGLPHTSHFDFAIPLFTETCTYTILILRPHALHFFFYPRNGTHIYKIYIIHAYSSTNHFIITIKRKINSKIWKIDKFNKLCDVK